MEMVIKNVFTSMTDEAIKEKVNACITRVIRDQECVRQIVEQTGTSLPAVSNVV